MTYQLWGINSVPPGGYVTMTCITVGHHCSATWWLLYMSVLFHMISPSVWLETHTAGCRLSVLLLIGLMVGKVVRNERCDSFRKDVKLRLEPHCGAACLCARKRLQHHLGDKVSIINSGWSHCTVRVTSSS